MEVLCGILYSSVIGHYLWKIFYDDLLQLEFRREVRLVGFADFIEQDISAPKESLLEEIGNPALELVNQ